MIYLASMVEWDIIFSLNSDFILYLVVLVLIALSFLSFMVFRWIILIDSFSKIKPGFSVLYRYYLIGSFFNIFFPGALGGDVVRIHYSQKQYRLGIKKATAIIFFERVAGLVALTLIFCFSIFFNDAIADKISIDKEYTPLVIPLVLLIGFVFKKAASKKGYVISYITIGAILVLSILGQFADILIAYILCSYFDLTVTLWNLLTVMPLIFIVTVLPISIGGIGRPFDEISLNLPLFKEKGVEVKGVIINKIIPEKKSKVEKYLKKAFEKINLKVVGFIPYVDYLSEPDLFQICSAVNGKMIAGYEKRSEKVRNIIVGAMTPRHALDYFTPHSLIITPGDREDIILAGLTGYPENCIKGIVLTGGLYPHKAILKLIKKYDIPVIISPMDTYETASSINELVVKITELDMDKIEIAAKLIKENIRIEEVIN